jgi:hypothetical protein
VDEQTGSETTITAPEASTRSTAKIRVSTRGPGSTLGAPEGGQAQLRRCPRCPAVLEPGLDDRRMGSFRSRTCSPCQPWWPTSRETAVRPNRAFPDSVPWPSAGGSSGHPVRCYSTAPTPAQARTRVVRLSSGARRQHPDDRPTHPREPLSRTGRAAIEHETRAGRIAHRSVGSRQLSCAAWWRCAARSPTMPVSW